MSKKTKKGFTIVELVIVIAVIGILSAILIPTFANLTSQAQDAQTVSNLANAYTLYVEEACDYKVDSDGTAIKYLAQKDVFVVKEGETKGHIFTDAWQPGTIDWGTAPFDGTKTLVGTNAANSTYGGFVFYYNVA